MKAKFIFGISLFIIVVTAFTAAPFMLRPKCDYLPIVMILSDEDSGIYEQDHADYDPVYTMLKSSIESELPIIVSTPVLYWLTKRTAEGRNADFDWTQAMRQRYNVSVSNGKKFALLIPQKYGDKLDSLGFNKDYVQPIAVQQVQQIFLNDSFATQEIDIRELEKLLLKDNFMHQVAPKCFYIVGHGMDAMSEPHYLRFEPVMAQLPLYDMANMLQILNNANTRAVYLLTCYAAGNNLVQLQNLLSGTVTDERCPEMHSLNFPVLVQCTTDTSATRIAGKYFSLTGLFDDIMEWAHEPSNSEKLAKHLGALYAQAPADERFSNYPICRQPGSYSHFRALELPQTMVIHKGAMRSLTITIDPSVEMIQLYPSDAHKLTLHIDKKLPMMMSRISGPAHHFIGQLQIKAKGSTETVIQHIFLNGLDADDGKILYGIADKGWFIQKVQSNGKTIAEGLVVHKGSLKHARPMMTAVYKGHDGTYYRVQSSLPLYGGMPQPEKIDEKTYAQLIGRIFWQTMPGADALAEATDHAESLQNQRYLLDQFCNSLALKSQIITKNELIAEDFKMLEKGELMPEHYINYATYLHDNELVSAIVDATLAGTIFSPYDCLTLLVHLMADGHHDLALEQLHKITTQKNKKALSVAVDTLANMASDQRYTLIEKAHDDIFACLKTNSDTNEGAADEIKNQLAECIKTLENNNQKELAAHMIGEIRHSGVNIG